jgi:hypothetical protein
MKFFRTLGCGRWLLKTKVLKSYCFQHLTQGRQKAGLVSDNRFHQ